MRQCGVQASITQVNDGSIVYDLFKCIKDLSIHVENAYSNIVVLYIYQLFV